MDLSRGYKLDLVIAVFCAIAVFECGGPRQVQGDGSELCDSETSVSSLRQDMQRLLSAHNDVRGKMEAMEREMMWMKEGMLEKLEILSIKVEWAMVDGSAVPRNVSRFMSSLHEISSRLGNLEDVLRAYVRPTTVRTTRATTTTTTTQPPPPPPPPRRRRRRRWRRIGR